MIQEVTKHSARTATLETGQKGEQNGESDEEKSNNVVKVVKQNEDEQLRGARVTITESVWLYLLNLLSPPPRLAETQVPDSHDATRK